jgi:hypothetical protein
MLDSTLLPLLCTPTYCAAQAMHALAPPPTSGWSWYSLAQIMHVHAHVGDPATWGSRVLVLAVSSWRRNCRIPVCG